MSNNKYTNEFKKKVIDEYVSFNESFYSLERKYNISNSSISKEKDVHGLIIHSD